MARVAAECHYERHEENARSQFHKMEDPSFAGRARQLHMVDEHRREQQRDREAAIHD